MPGKLAPASSLVALLFAVFLGLGASGLPAATETSGLKEALRLATERAVKATSQSGGFLDNSKIRIGLPGSLSKMTKGLRAIGMGAQVDELEVAMNRAAEKAAGEATPVFVDAIQKMSFQDASAIVSGGDTAATDYFEKTTRQPLSERFRPIVDRAMQNVGLAKQYDQLVGRYTSLPLASAPKFDLSGYVTEKTLSGLFTVVGEQEKQIRTNPAARATDLLKQVFGK
ncbi:MAG TPA: DUF4197 domain-containing protein [Myxococcota bacterium]|jgi:hypothetical protein